MEYENQRRRDMTREEAIERGKEQLEIFGGEHREFIELAIEVLKQEPCEDAISRKAVVDIFKCRVDMLERRIARRNGSNFYDQTEAIGIFQLKIDEANKYVELINNLPSVQPKEPRRKGKWIKSNIPEEDYTCSECGGACWYYDYERGVAKSDYCPNCGADMREE